MYMHTGTGGIIMWCAIYALYAHTMIYGTIYGIMWYVIHTALCGCYVLYSTKRSIVYSAVHSTTPRTIVGIIYYSIIS